MQYMYEENRILNVYHMKDIYKIRLNKFEFEYLYFFLNSDKILCYYCYAMIKYWFR